MKQLNEVAVGEIFIFASNGLKYAYDAMDGTKYKTLNRKKFKCTNPGQYMEVVQLHGKYIINEFSETLDCFIHGKGYNKNLFNEFVTIINN